MRTVIAKDVATGISVEALPLTLKLTPIDIAEKLGLTKSSNRNKARLYLAVGALMRSAVKDFGPMSRSQLFSVPTELPFVSPALEKESVSKSWQQDFLTLLTKAEIFQELQGPNGGKLYQVGDERLLSLLVYDSVYSDQHAIRRLLWPADYDVPTANDFKEAEASAVSTEPAEVVVPEPAEPSLEVIDKVATNLKGVADHLGELYRQATKQRDDLELLTSSITDLVNVIEAFDRKFDTIAKRIDTAVQKLEKIADDRTQEERTQLLQLVTKLVEGDARKKSLTNQLEGESRKVEELIRTIDTKLSGNGR